MLKVIDLPVSIIIRREDIKRNYDEEYKLTSRNCYYNKILDRVLLIHNGDNYLTLKTIRRLCEIWIDADKLFFLIKNYEDIKKPHFIDAHKMLQLLKE